MLFGFCLQTVAGWMVGSVWCCRLRDKAEHWSGAVFLVVPTNGPENCVQNRNWNDELHSAELYCAMQWCLELNNSMHSITADAFAVAALV